MTEMVERVARALWDAHCEVHTDEGSLVQDHPLYVAQARAAIAIAQEEFAKIAEAVKVSANGHPQMDAPTPADMQRAIVAAIRDEALK